MGGGLSSFLSGKFMGLLTCLDISLALLSFCLITSQYHIIADNT